MTYAEMAKSAGVSLPSGWNYMPASDQAKWIKTYVNYWDSNTSTTPSTNRTNSYTGVGAGGVADYLLINFSLGGVSISSLPPRYFESLTHKIHTNQEANAIFSEWSLELKYIPETFEEGNPNLVEFQSALQDCVDITGQYGTTEETYGIRCVYSYGYAKDGLGKTYEGFCTSFKTTLSEGYITYSLSGYANSVPTSNCAKRIFAPIDVEIQPSTIISQVCSECFPSWAQDIDHTDDVYKFDQTAKFMTPMEFLLGENVSGNTDNDSTLFKGLVNFAKYKNGQDSYYLIFDDTLPRTIRFKRSKQGAIGNTMVFNWGNNITDSRVISFDVTYDGTGALIAGKLKNSLRVSNINMDIDDLGQFIASATTSDINNAGSYTSMLAQNTYIQSTMASAMAMPYSATLTILGTNQPFGMLQKIVVVPLINGSPHHTAGTYSIMGVEDSLQSDGLYTTRLSLLREQDDSAYWEDRKANLCGDYYKKFQYREANCYEEYKGLQRAGYTNVGYSNDYYTRTGVPRPTS